MAGMPHQKQKVLLLLRILLDKSDAQRPMTLAELAQALGEYGIVCERKSLYRDLDSLTASGFPIERVRSKDTRYYWAGAPFSREDLILLFNLIRISPSVPRKRKPELLKKLSLLTSQAQREACGEELLTVFPDRTVSERSYSTAELFFEAILQRKKVRFLYKGSALRDLSLRRRATSTAQTVSPYRLVWSDGYFLAGADAQGELTLFRLDRIEEPTVTELPVVDIREIGGDLDFDLDQYIKGVFASREEPVSMIFRVSESFLAAAERHFPSDSVVETEGNGWYLLSCEACADDALFGWLLMHGDQIRIVYPSSLVARVREISERVSAAYGAGKTAE